MMFSINPQHVKGLFLLLDLVQIGRLATVIYCYPVKVFKVAREGHDQNVYIFLLAYLWSKYFFFFQIFRRGSWGYALPPHKLLVT